MISDFGKLQATDPTAPNYLSATCSGSGNISLRIGPEGQRPWTLAVTAQLNGGYLNENDQITLIFGDGKLRVTWISNANICRRRVRISSHDRCSGNRNFLPLDQQFTIPVVAGPAVKWVAVLPTLRRPNEPFFLGLKAEDNGQPYQ